MNRIVLFASLLLLAACSKEAPEAPVPAEHPSEPAVRPAVPSEAPAPADEAPEPAAAKPEITDASLAKFVVYQGQVIDLLQNYLALVQSRTEAMRGKDTAQVMQEVAAVQQLEKKMKADKERIRLESGLTEEEAEYLTEVVGDVMIERMIYQNAGGDAQMETMRQGLEKQIAAAPEAEREAAKAQLDEILAGFAKGARAGNAREEHGDAAVDLVLAREAELLPLQQRMMNKTLGAGR